MKLSESQIKEFESKYINRIITLFKPKSKLHHKWYSVNKDVLNQFGTVVHLFASNPEQIIFETYDHGKPSQVEIIFFDNKLNEINAIKLSNKWSIGKRISDIRSDKKYEIIDPKGEVKILELGSNLYTKVWKGIISKMNTTEI
jgi:hypothetical protein